MTQRAAPHNHELHIREIGLSRPNTPAEIAAVRRLLATQPDAPTLTQILGLP